MLLDEYRQLNEQDAPTKKELEAERMFQEDMDMIVEWLRENGYADLDDDYSVYSEAVYTTKKTSGQTRAFSKEHYFNLSKSMAAIAAARAAGSNDYKQLVRASHIRRKLIAKINKQYASVAKKSAKQALKDAKKVSNPMVKAPKEGLSGTKTTNNSLKPKVTK